MQSCTFLLALWPEVIAIPNQREDRISIANLCKASNFTSLTN